MGLNALGGRSKEEIEDIVGAMADAGYGLEYDDAAGLIAATRRGPNPYDAAQTFTESDLSVTTGGNGEVSGGSAQIVNLDDTFISIAQASKSGNETWETIASQDYSITVPNTTVNASFDARSGDNPYRIEVRVRDVTNGVTLASCNRFMETFATFTGSEEYATPQDITMEVQVQNSTSTVTAYMENVEVTAAATPPSANIFVEWPHPADIFEWDAATFTKSLDGETVDVFVAYDDGSGWTRTNGGDPISRNYSLGEDSNISPSDSVRIEAELSRADTANNPTLDSAYRSWVL